MMAPLRRSAAGVTVQVSQWESGKRTFMRCVSFRAHVCVCARRCKGRRARVESFTPSFRIDSVTKGKGDVARGKEPIRRKLFGFMPGV
ncbi:hypothetical protein EYF80_061407 [Liparis tanakae]|uniref:Uncharacterized protein n=1 Tax=Liparis tanakae TaxID=230148 RepID=A0A4Z2EI50_9TELE|nr:hypothetical protein EYF80_061407 [Liparis tanakae]